MKVLVALDSFKGSLTSLEAGQAVAEGIKACDPKAETLILPLADGGEGTVEALTYGLKGQEITLQVTGPLGQPVNSTYGILPDGTAVMEMASAAGLPLVPLEKRNPLYTTTFGLGEMIRDAINRGCRKFLIGIGGSATNDGGMGMLQALGFVFTDIGGSPSPFGAFGLKDLHMIHTSQAMPELSECTFQIACDVKNPLFGPTGCSMIFAPQKGASILTAEHMDRWMAYYSDMVREVFPHADPWYPGAGAAGGLGFAFSSFLNAQLSPGAELVLKLLRMEALLPLYDIVITGEGCLDEQSIMGKGPGYLAKLAKEYRKPVIAYAGILGNNVAVCKEQGIDAYYPTLPSFMPLEEAMVPQTAYRNLKQTVMETFMNIKIGSTKA